MGEDTLGRRATVGDGRRATVGDLRRVTARDVADAAGVSPTTVSYVLNDRPHQSIPKSTRQRVLEAAARLGYAPSPAARSLATGRSNLVIGLLSDWPASTNSGQFLRRLTGAFAKYDYVFLAHTPADPVEAGDRAELLWRSAYPAAALIMDDVGPDERDRIRAAGVRVIMDLWNASGTGTGLLEATSQAIGGAQVRHLAEAGHTRLGYAWPDDDRLHVFAHPRLAGVRAACADLGLQPPVVRTVPLTAEGACAAVMAWHATDSDEDGRVTGVCGYNDEVAIAVLDGARRAGLKVPDDLAVIGVDDIPTAGFTVPPLSTINHNRTRTADFIATTVVEALQDGGRVEPDYTRFFEVVRREST